MQMISMICRPQILREVALGRPESTAVVVNAVTGILFVAAISLPWLSVITGSLVAVLIVLFGPLAGFTVSSLYPRIEWAVGRRLGGKASCDELYRLFAWSFLTTGFGVILYSLLIISFQKLPAVLVPVILVPTGFFLLFTSVRNYCSNIIAVQQFTPTRGGISIAVTCALFLILIAGCGGLLSLLFSLGMKNSPNPFGGL